jgi:hypothetical protein
VSSGSGARRLRQTKVKYASLPATAARGPTQVQIEQCAFRNDGLLVKSPSLRSENKNIGREFVQPGKNAPNVSEENSVKSEAQRRYFEANKSKLK